MADLWDSANPPTPLEYDATEGYPTPAGVEVEAVYANLAAEREGRQILGVRFDPADPAQVDPGGHDQAIRSLFRTYCLLRYFEELTIDLYSEAANLDAPWDMKTGRAYVSADGANSYVVMEDITLEYAGLLPGSGMAVRGHRGMARVTDCYFVGAGDLRCDMQRELLPIGQVDDPGNEHDGEWYYEVLALQVGPGFPYLWLGTSESDKAICVNSIYTWSDVFKSFKTYHALDGDGNPYAINAYIDGNHFCSKMLDGPPPPGAFEANCKNTLCPYYAARGLCQPLDYGSELFTARGLYVRTSGDPPVNTYGYEKFMGFGHAIGCLPMPGLTDGNSVLPGNRQFSGAVKSYVGVVDCAVVLSGWNELARAADADAVGLLAGAGGIDVYSTRAKTADADSGFEGAKGIRRIHGCGWGEDAAPVLSGNGGEANVQRVMPRIITTAQLAYGDGNWPANGQFESERDESLVDAYATPQALWDATAYDTVITIPRFGCGYSLNSNVHQKTLVGAVVSSAAVNGSVLTLEFDLAERQLPEAADPEQLRTFDSGGNVAKGELIWECSYDDGVSAFGDRQRRIYPGDVVMFTKTGLPAWLAGAAFIVLTAEAFGGSADSGATAPTPRPLYCSDKVFADYANRDKITVALTGVNGTQLADWLDSGGSLEDATVAAYHGAVIPEAATVTVVGYDVSTGTTFEVEPVGLDRAAGKIYLDGSEVFTSHRSLRLCVKTDVSDVRDNWSGKNFVAARNLVESLWDGWQEASGFIGNGGGYIRGGGATDLFSNVSGYEDGLTEPPLSAFDPLVVSYSDEEYDAAIYSAFFAGFEDVENNYGGQSSSRAAVYAITAPSNVWKSADIKNCYAEFSITGAKETVHYSDTGTQTTYEAPTYDFCHASIDRSDPENPVYSIDSGETGVLSIISSHTTQNSPSSWTIKYVVDITESLQAAIARVSNTGARNIQIGFAVFAGDGREIYDTVESANDGLNYAYGNAPGAIYLTPQDPGEPWLYSGYSVSTIGILSLGSGAIQFDIAGAAPLPYFYRADGGNVPAYVGNFEEEEE